MKKVLLLALVLLIAAAVGSVFAEGQQEGADGEKVYKVGVIPKFIAEDYFIACENGFREAEKELGNIRVDWVGDTMAQTSAANQKNYIQSFIDRQYDAILVSALDPESYADTLKEAMDQGIKVVTWDADVRPDARDWFVNQAEFDQIGIACLKGIAGDLSDYSANDKATVAMVSTTTDSPNQNAWLDAIISEYEKNKSSKYKHINLLSDEIVYAGNDQGTADEKVKALLNANPDIDGIIALSSNTAPAVSSARDQLNLKKEIKIIGIAVPETQRADMEAGKMSAVVLWQPFDLGYLTLQLAYDLLEGNEPSGDRYKSPLSGTLMAPNFSTGEPVLYPEKGHKIMEDNVIILGPPIVWNLENIGNFRGYPTDAHGMNTFLSKE
ncbi:MAG: substrate-binding domain-containing protein [Spirochaetales bacterium]|nr:substrate-binding domain-containing protein [Spirochaetales bacterium]MCF7938320.1 substrate-binding domain-containing protein [Spirochaetales bacterium]